MPGIFDMTEVLAQVRAEGRAYEEFLRYDSMSVGLYYLRAGEPDRQQPHTEDEIYYVTSGEGRIDIGGDVSPVRPGNLIFVAKHVEHRFLDYPEGLTLLVVFAPPRGSATER